MMIFGIQVGMDQIAIHTHFHNLLQLPLSYQNGRHGKPMEDF